MSKFTIFTIILSISVVTVTADLVLRDYFQTGGANIIKSDEISPVISSEERLSRDEQPRRIESNPAPERQPVEQTIAEQTTALIEPVAVAPSAPVITADLVRQAGFTDDFVEKQFNGKVFQLLDITRNPVDNISMYEVSENGSAAVSITEITLSDEIRALQLYILLQNKTKPYIDLSLNETNAYGDRSFYINHAKKPNEAFLTMKIGHTIYAFAYVKTRHPEVKKLIALLTP